LGTPPPFRTSPHGPKCMRVLCTSKGRPHGETRRRVPSPAAVRNERRSQESVMKEIG
jgi:hypothetical protein